MSAANKIQNWSAVHSHCGKGGCSRDVDIVFTAVEHQGKRIVDAFSKFGTWDVDPKTKKTINLKLYPEYEFLNWIVRCQQCYEDDLLHSNNTIQQKMKNRTRSGV